MTKEKKKRKYLKDKSADCFLFLSLPQGRTQILIDGEVEQH